MVREMQEYLRPSVGVNWGVTRKPGMGCAHSSDTLRASVGAGTHMWWKW